jgi:hypothetical protein
MLAVVRIVLHFVVQRYQGRAQIFKDGYPFKCILGSIVIVTLSHYGLLVANANRIREPEWRCFSQPSYMECRMRDTTLALSSVVCAVVLWSTHNASAWAQSAASQSSDFRPGQVCRGVRPVGTANRDFWYFWIRFNEGGSADVWRLGGPQVPLEAIPVTAPDSADHVFDRYVTRFEGGWVGIQAPSSGDSGLMLQINLTTRTFVNAKNGLVWPIVCVPS